MCATLFNIQFIGEFCAITPLLCRCCCCRLLLQPLPPLQRRLVRRRRFVCFGYIQCADCPQELCHSIFALGCQLVFLGSHCQSDPRLESTNLTTTTLSSHLTTPQYTPHTEQPAITCSCSVPSPATASTDSCSTAAGWSAGLSHQACSRAPSNCSWVSHLATPLSAGCQLGSCCLPFLLGL